MRENPAVAGKKDAVDVTLILPAFNEVETIGRTISSAAAWFRSQGLSYEIVVSADGDDGTRERASELAASDPAIRVLGEPGRRGKGLAVREAVAISRGDVVGFADADGKVPVEELANVLPAFRSGSDVVIGSRSGPGATVERPAPLHRRAGSAAFAFLIHGVLGLEEIVDLQCGFKFFRGEVARPLFAQMKVDGYMFDVELLVLARELGCTVTQVPVRCRYDRDSRFKLFAGTLRNAREILGILSERRARSRRPR